MSSVTITPSVLSGTVQAPPSLHDTVRLIWGCCLGEGGAIGNCRTGFELDAMIALGRQLGADINFKEGITDILATGIPGAPRVMRCQSRISARFALALALSYDYQIQVICPPLPARATKFIDELARASGSQISFQQNSIFAKGPLDADGYLLSGLEGAYWSSQMLMAAPLWPVDSFFQFDDFSSTRPALTSTLSVLEVFGASFNFNPEGQSLIMPGDQVYKNRMLESEGDWRNGSYLIGALLAAGSGKIGGLSAASSQNERAAWREFEKLGVLSWNERGDVVSVKASQLPSIPIDPRHAPALTPLWMALGVHAQSPISIGPLLPMSPLDRRRVDIMADRLMALGIQVERLADSIMVHPGKLEGGTVDCEKDCRVSMAMAIAALGGRSKITLANVDGVAREYSDFWATLHSLGADIALPILASHKAEKPMLP